MMSLVHTESAIVPAPLQQSFAEVDAGAVHLPQWQSLALQIQHNLQYQHHWSDLHVHTHSPLTNEPLPRPLVSGLPPQRLYVHPDEQVELLKDADRKRKANKAGGETGALQVDVEPELEWVLPTRLNEKWSLRRLAEVFDAISSVPPSSTATVHQDPPKNPWRTTKRVLLGTVDSDSTVVYYFVHDGVVKPRQN
ncbi:tRNA-splicing endonuclease subunit Sen15 [Phaeosphaeria sp. MPI-PUGE-AT-0046c]|nr:tRNA-splicing endonuclease subunit Sen15 [Phaeosphaeria sp. MPI-PUGE-AT-0046c]